MLYYDSSFFFKKNVFLHKTKYMTMKTLILEYDENDPKCIQVIAIAVAYGNIKIVSGENPELFQAIEKAKGTVKSFTSFEDFEENIKSIIK